MTQSPSFFVNNPVSGQHYWSILPVGCIAAAGDSLTVTVRAFTGLNGTGTPVVCTTIIAWVWDYNTGLSVQANTGSSVSSITSNTTAATAGHDIQCSGYYVGSGVGSLEMFITYTTSAPYAPTITSFTPPVGGIGQSVQINGTHLIDLSAVYFNGLLASFTINSETQITAIVPNGATAGLITVHNATGVDGNSATSFLIGVIRRWAAGVWKSINIDPRRSGAWGAFLPQVRRGASWITGS